MSPGPSPPGTGGDNGTDADAGGCVRLHDPAGAGLEGLAAQVADSALGRRYHLSGPALLVAWAAAAGRGELVLAVGEPGAWQGILRAAPLGAFGAPYLSFVAVADGARGRGLGERLVRAFLSQLPSPRRGHFLLATAGNQAALRLYLRLGFVAVGGLRGLVRPELDELIFWRRPPPSPLPTAPPPPR